jgi:serine protease Do
LNYALPIEELRGSVSQILEGKFSPTTEQPKLKPEESIDLAALGLVLVPDVLERTPPFVDLVRGGSAAATAGVRPDDLIVFIGENLVHSCQGFRDELAHIERNTPLKLVLMRGQDLIEVELPAVEESRP